MQIYPQQCFPVSVNGHSFVNCLCLLLFSLFFHRSLLVSAVMFHATVSEQTPDTPVSFVVVLYPKNWSYKNYFTCAIGREAPSLLRWRHSFFSTVRPAAHTNQTRNDRTFRKRSSKQMNLRIGRLFLFFWTESILKIKFLKTVEFSFNTNSKWPAIAAFLN